MTPEQYSPQERVFSNHVLAHLKNFSCVIDVTRFINAFGWDMQRVMDLYVEVLWNSPEIFYVAKAIQFKWEYYSDGTARYAKLFGIQYAFPKCEYLQNKMRLDAVVKDAVSYAARESSPEMIALRLHDYIVKICEYDTSSDQSDTSPLARTAYSVLVRKKAVCEGYTMAYRYLLGKFNIQSEEIISDEMNHCWNYVNIRGRWYHVDVTYDDPVWVGNDGRRLRGKERLLAETANAVSRKHFLMSDFKAIQTAHHGWTTKGLPPAKDKVYDDKTWN